MATKRLQLRGISRTPSDRMTDDGGCSESLNVQLDSTEIAPAFVPEDVTTELGLPADLQAERIFVHKTANYENYIVVQKGKVVAYTPGIEDEEPLSVLDLEEGEEVSDITSVGNTLIVATTNNLYYALYKSGVYSFLGNRIPFPWLTFSPQNSSTKIPIFGNIDSSNPEALNSAKISTSNWNAEYENGQLSHSSIYINSFLNVLWSAIEDASNTQLRNGRIIGGIIIRYAIELYDGSKFSSMPILVGNGQKEAFSTKVKIYKTVTVSPQSEISVKIKGYTYRFEFPTYGININLSDDFPWDDYKDIISSINIYVSQFPISPLNRQMSYITNEVTEIEDNETYGSNRTTTRTLRLGDQYDTSFIPNILDYSSRTYLIGKIFLNDRLESLISYKELIDGAPLPLERLSGITIENLERLEEDDMKHYNMLASKFSFFNNKLLLVQASQVIDYDYNQLNAYDIVNHDSSGQETTVTYDVTYLLRGYSKNVVVKKEFKYYYSDFYTERVYAFQIFPDSRAYKMLVKATITTSGTEGTTEIKYGEFDMLPHPYLDCAYYYGGIENELVDLCLLDSVENYPAYQIDDSDNKLIISEQDNPFIFPLNSRYTFQAKIVGVAIATTALSQGQFGQFPLYVFTEDGIWAMETAADGSFISQKPLSREVCINPDSICSIDNAVVFVTSKAVMMIQGSQVVNISPYMNGRHYMPNASALSIIEKQEGFGDLIAPISDSDPFMKFMRDAKVAYDYTGQRLIFISESNKGFQYVYKIDTQTWHKVAFEGFDLIQPLNSYPECRVLSQSYHTTLLWCHIDTERSPIPEETSPFWNEVYELFYEYYDDYYHWTDIVDFINGDMGLEVLDEAFYAHLRGTLEGNQLYYSLEYEDIYRPKVYSLSTVLDASRNQDTAKGIIITRPFDLDEPDVYKTIADVRIRGQFPRGAVKFILLGSNDGINYCTISTLRGKSWKLFRMVILADLAPTERISWVDIQYEPRYNNKLR